MSVPTNSDVVLYRLQACPFCERVVRKLNEYGVDYDSRFVRPMHSYRNVVKRVANTRLVPVLVEAESGVVIAESDNIVQYLDDRYGGETNA